MGAKYKTVKDNLHSMEKTVKSLNGKKVNVGVLEGENAWLAAIHEYGCRINVTPKMRAFLHHQGFHLRAETTVIVIPERSFLRTGHDVNIKKIMDQSEVLLADVLGGTMSEDEFLKTIGVLMSSEIKDYARNLRTPPNHPYTIKQKGSANPLVDSGNMIGGITYEVE